MSQLFDAMARAETVIHIESMCVDPDEISDAVKDFFENMPEREDAALYKSLPRLKAFMPNDEDGNGDAGALVDTLIMRGIKGFFVLAATPVRKWLNKTMITCSWGYYHTEWIYVQSGDQIGAEIAKWADEMAERDREKKH